MAVNTEILKQAWRAVCRRHLSFGKPHTEGSSKPAYAQAQEDLVDLDCVKTLPDNEHDLVVEPIQIV